MKSKVFYLNTIAIQKWRKSYYDGKMEYKCKTHQPSITLW